MATESILSAYLTGESWVAKRASWTRPPLDLIRELAYRLYELRGRRDGHAMEDWLCAESQLANDPGAWTRAAWPECGEGELS